MVGKGQPKKFLNFKSEKYIMYTYDTRNLSSSALQAVMRNLMKENSEEEAKQRLIQKYPNLEGDIMAMTSTINTTPYVVQTPFSNMAMNEVNDMYDADAELDVSELVDNSDEFDEVETLIKTVDPVVSEPVVKATKAPKEKVEKAPKAPKEPKVVVEKAPKAESKAHRAMELYMKSEDKSRATIIKLFMSELGMTQSGASTYHYNCKTAAK